MFFFFVQETLGSERDFVNMSCKQWCYLIFLRSITNVIALAFKAGSIYLIIFVSDLDKVASIYISCSHVMLLVTCF